MAAARRKEKGTSSYIEIRLVFVMPLGALQNGVPHAPSLVRLPGVAAAPHSRHDVDAVEFRVPHHVVALMGGGG